jgi:hypothetical protein
MRLLRLVLPALFACCLLLIAGSAFAVTATPATLIVASTSPAQVHALPPDPFLDGAVTTSVGAICTECNPTHEDNCVGVPNHGACNDNAPGCHCRKCDGSFLCWAD